MKWSHWSCVGWEASLETPEEARLVISWLPAEGWDWLWTKVDRLKHVFV